VEKLQAKLFWKHSKHNHFRNTSNKNLETLQSKIWKHFKLKIFLKNFTQNFKKFQRKNIFENTSRKNILETPQSKPF